VIEPVPQSVGAPGNLHSDERAHFLATLAFEHRVEGDTAIGRATVTDYASLAPGWPSAAVLLTYADVLIGLLASHQTAPRISITSSLSVHLPRPAPAGTELDLVGRLTKLGRTVTVGETTVRAVATGEVIGFAVGTFQASPRPQDVTPGSFDRFRRPEKVTSSARSLSDHVGLAVVQPGMAEISLRSDLTNSTESLQGGLVALLGEVAAQTAATTELGAPAVVDSLEVHYVAAARVGPFRAEANPLSSGPRNLYRVEIRDPGRDDRIVAEVVARTRPATGSAQQP
jgi:acyl-coenzyme A thioesterase PaaI-like protein